MIPPESLFREVVLEPIPRKLMSEFKSLNEPLLLEFGQTPLLRQHHRPLQSLQGLLIVLEAHVRRIDGENLAKQSNLGIGKLRAEILLVGETPTLLKISNRPGGGGNLASREWILAMPVLCLCTRRKLRGCGHLGIM